jgi:chaperonin GroES
VKLRPLNDKLIVKPLKAEEKTKSGIIIPDSAKEKPQEAEVIAVGPGKVNETTGVRNPIDIKVGEKVLYSKYSGNEFKLDGEDVLMLDEGDILAVIEK